MENRQKTYRILYFEDEAPISDMYAKKFMREGIDLVVYESPTLNPVSIVLKEKPDLIMMDILMPVMDGIIATKLLKKDERTKNIPLIILTNLGQQNEVEKGVEVGADDYFIKVHYTPNELIAKIREHLQ